MDFKQIQELIKLINKSNIGEVTIEEKGFKLTIKQKEEPVQNVIAAPVHTSMMTAMPQQSAATPAAQATAPAADKPKAAEAVAGRLGCDRHASAVEFSAVRNLTGGTPPNTLTP